MKEAALRLLSRRDHSRAELTTKLRQRGFDTDELIPVLNHLAELGLLSDQRYCESLINARIHRGHGPLKIRHELQQQGISEEMIHQHFAHYDEDFWQNQLMKLWRQKFSSKIPSDRREISRQQRFLQQRGFSPADIYRLFRGHKDHEYE